MAAELAAEFSAKKALRHFRPCKNRRFSKEPGNEDGEVHAQEAKSRLCAVQPIGSLMRRARPSQSRMWKKWKTTRIPKKIWSWLPWMWSRKHQRKKRPSFYVFNKLFCVKPPQAERELAVVPHKEAA